MTEAHVAQTADRTAQCACGALTARTQGEPASVYGCSCLTCQRGSGSTFSYAALFAATAVTIEGTHTRWRHRSDSGRWVESLFCPTCGSTVAFTAEAMPGMVGVPAGCFADPDFPRPTRFFWGAHRHRWLEVPPNMEWLPTQ